MKSAQILIVDDNEENRYFLTVLLRGNGYKISIAVNGAEALEIARQEPPTLVIADILMPVMDGFALCREWKKDEKLKTIPFIMYTATYTDNQDEEFAKKIGADRFIVKPCEPEILLNSIREVISGDGSDRARGETESQLDSDVLRLYSERLVQKLEQKMMQLEREAEARRKAEIALRESEEKYRHLFETMPQGVVYQDTEGKIIYANPAAEEILGLTLDQMHERTSHDSKWRAIHEDGSNFPGEDHPSMMALRSGQPVQDIVMGVYNPCRDQRRWIKIAAIPLFRPGDLNPHQVYAIFDDITNYKQLQEQFLQSQKMEAVGALAGGVAHDFNNLLTVIRGYAEVLMEGLSANDPGRDEVEQILRAGKQAASLTTQLLAFSRKQILQLKVLNLNDIVRDVGKMLYRLIGEDIKLELRIQPNLGLIHADPGQIQQILLNLAVNSRDAMLQGGRLTIETADVRLDEEFVRKHPFAKQGAHILLSVRDSGVGMDETIQARIFEPFFTTKAQGEGTGLGLSTVYGIVKQSNGFILVNSGLGKGTLFRIYFPRVEGEPDVLADEQKSDAVHGNGETVMIAEDDPSVRELTCRILRERGYHILEASNGYEALEIARKYAGKIDLVLTDIVMPGMNGAELVRQLEVIRPGTKSLYVSGYANGGIAQDIHDIKVDILLKPFSIDRLLYKVYKVIHSAE